MHRSKAVLLCLVQNCCMIDPRVSLDSPHGFISYKAHSHVLCVAYPCLFKIAYALCAYTGYGERGG